MSEQMNRELAAALRRCCEEMDHGLFFITHREKMHPHGVELFEEAIGLARGALRFYSVSDTRPIADRHIDDGGAEEASP